MNRKPRRVKIHLIQNRVRSQLLGNNYACALHLCRVHIPVTVAEVYPEFVEWLGENGTFFPSATHVWYALRAKNQRTFDKFTKNGEFGSVSVAFFRKATPSGRLRSKTARALAEVEMLKQNHQVGRIALKAVAKQNRRCFSLGSTDFDPRSPEERLDRGALFDFWKAVIGQKARQNRNVRKALLATRDNAIFFHYPSSNSSVLGGNNILDHFKGRNLIGDVMTVVRKELRDDQ